MSELGNALKTLRGTKSQRDIAQASGLNVRTIQRAESGLNGLTLPTLRTLARHFRLAPPQYAALLITWIKLELGDDFSLLEVRSKAGKTAPLTDMEQLIETFKGVPRKYQKELLRAAQRHEIMRSLAPLNELYDSLTSRDGHDGH